MAMSLLTTIAFFLQGQIAKSWQSHHHVENVKRENPKYVLTPHDMPLGYNATSRFF
jgi:hypothetical protein